MTITLNGEPKALAASLSVTALLEELGLAGRPVLVELNREALLPKQYADHQLSDGDEVEIISIVAGG